MNETKTVETRMPRHMQTCSRLQLHPGALTFFEKIDKGDGLVKTEHVGANGH